MFVAADGKIAGLLGITDPIKESTPKAIEQLHKEGFRIVMLTGDKMCLVFRGALRLFIL